MTQHCLDEVIFSPKCSFGFGFGWGSGYKSQKLAGIFPSCARIGLAVYVGANLIGGGQMAVPEFHE